MRNLVSGIILVVCLDFAFIAYLLIVNGLTRPAHIAAIDTLDRRRGLTLRQHELDERLQAAEIDQLFRGETEKLIARSSQPDAPQTHIVEPKTRVRSHDQVLRARVDLKPRIIEYSAAQRPDIATLKEANTTVILYHQPSRTADKPSPTDITPKAARTGESQDIADIRKRSYIARVFPIFKKPADWVRMLGAKLR